MKINSIILCGIVMTACNCTTEFKNSTTDATSSSSTTTSTSETGIFTSTEYSDSNSSASSDFSSGSTTFVSDLNSVESGSSDTGETIAKCNNSETGECKVFVTSMSTFPNIKVDGFDNFCTIMACGSDFICKPYRAVIRRDSSFWEIFSSFEGSYVLPSGKVVASGNDSLEFSNSINENELGELVSNKTPVWSGFEGILTTCPANDSWQTNDPLLFGDVGYVGGVNSAWYTGHKVSCNDVAHVICVEVAKE
jgi:hypothetical protein